MDWFVHGQFALHPFAHLADIIHVVVKRWNKEVDDFIPSVMLLKDLQCVQHQF